jgi:hypothetical protein
MITDLNEENKYCCRTCYIKTACSCFEELKTECEHGGPVKNE